MVMCFIYSPVFIEGKNLVSGTVKIHKKDYFFLDEAPSCYFVAYPL